MSKLQLAKAYRKSVGDPGSVSGPKDLELVYDGTHSNDKTTLHFQVIVRASPTGFSASIDFGDSLGPGGLEEGTVENALKRLGRWCERASQVLINFEGEKTAPL